MSGERKSLSLSSMTLNTEKKPPVVVVLVLVVRVYFKNSMMVDSERVFTFLTKLFAFILSCFNHRN